MKYFLIAVFLILNAAFAGGPPSDKARGMFLTLGVGPKTPVGTFANSSMIGSGVNAELDYADNESLPLFLFGKIEFLHFPGSQQFYQSSDYSHFSTNMLPLTVGGRYYFYPMMENFVVILPYLEAGAHFALFQKLHQFKISTNLPSYIEDNVKFGFSVGGGVSMFLMELYLSYTYFKSNQYLGLDFRFRLPMSITI